MEYRLKVKISTLPCPFGMSSPATNHHAVKRCAIGIAFVGAAMDTFRAVAAKKVLPSTWPPGETVKIEMTPHG